MLKVNFLHRDGIPKTDEQTKEKGSTNFQHSHPVTRWQRVTTQKMQFSTDKTKRNNDKKRCFQRGFQRHKLPHSSP
jgi:hypothetical protein